MFEVQLRSEEEGITLKPTLKEAMEYAKEHPSVWKISFDAPSGERVRLVWDPNGWLYEPLILNPQDLENPTADVQEGAYQLKGYDS